MLTRGYSSAAAALSLACLLVSCGSKEKVAPRVPEGEVVLSGNAVASSEEDPPRELEGEVVVSGHAIATSDDLWIGASEGLFHWSKGSDEPPELLVKHFQFLGPFETDNAVYLQSEAVSDLDDGPGACVIRLEGCRRARAWELREALEELRLEDVWRGRGGGRGRLFLVVRSRRFERRSSSITPLMWPTCSSRRS